MRPRGPALIIAILVALVRLPGALAQFPPGSKPQIAILVSPGAEGILEPNRAELALWYAALELGASQRPMPRIILVHGCQRSAHVANLDRDLPLVLNPEKRKRLSRGSVVSQSGVGDQTVWYMWIVGKPQDEWIAAGMLNIVRFQFDIQLTRSQYDSALRRITSRLNHFISAQALKAEK